jgi:hypothetical protein
LERPGLLVGLLQYYVHLNQSLPLFLVKLLAPYGLFLSNRVFSSNEVEARVDEERLDVYPDIDLALGTTNVVDKPKKTLAIEPTTHIYYTGMLERRFEI